MKRSLLVVLLILIADQVLKIWIKTNMYLGQEYRITDWFIIHFTENPGMAFGFEFGGEWGKLALSIFRIITVIAIIFWMRSLFRDKTPFVGILAVSLILAGAIGNILDSAFYGLIFDESTRTQVASFMPPEGGYASFLHGRVVDMFYFPIYKGYLPEWIPFKGGDYFIFFRPIFNIADSAITAGVILLLIVQKKVFKS